MAGRRRIYATRAEQQAHHRRRQDLTTHLDAGVYVTDLADLVGCARQYFRCLYADPPWQYSNQGTRGSTRQHYTTLSSAALAALPVSQLAAPQSHLYLWVTVPLLKESLALLEAWDFTYKTHLVWDKMHMGMGNYVRVQHELLLLGTRGTRQPLVHDVRSVLRAPRQAHSAKPEEMREQIMRLTPGPYLELFGRRAVPGWVVWGNQLIRTWYQQPLFAVEA
jgi:N6-adenosine-specific RNA methylase IME4